MASDSFLSTAYDLACNLHDGQSDKNGYPYLYHVERVANKSRTLWNAIATHDVQNIVWTVGILHDIVEDTEMTLDRLLEEGIPESVISVVDLLTCRDNEQYDDYIQRIVDSKNTIAVHIKLCDIYDNLDPDRITKLDEKTRDRLEAKYGFAIGNLLQGFYR